MEKKTHSLSLSLSLSLQNFTDWKISQDNSCSDHNIIQFKIGHNNKHERQHNCKGPDIL